ncbi:protein of unknown function (plasmid) [Azospirillum baldaniorum]|uniref:Uncharacterized protein n=1 Tax=Azospirillum baldaniorum TaxID=1064539 RepID=A0A9P1K0Q3_9PROT|nr:protein of unknown function [Azospirillum baldaniorum]
MFVFFIVSRTDVAPLCHRGPKPHKP